MKNGIVKLIIIGSTVTIANSYAMEQWARTTLTNLGINLGLTEPKPASPTEELKRIIDREDTFKNVGLAKIQELIGRQANPNVVGDTGKTALLVAISDYKSGEEPLVVNLLARHVGADINKRYAEGKTPLAIAAGDGKPDLIPILIRFGADIHTRDDQRNTPLILAARHADQQKAVEVAKRLQDAGIDVNARNANGETALYRAVLRKNHQLIQFLVTHGADVNIPNAQGQTPLALAQANNDQQAIDLLTPRAEKI